MSGSQRAGGSESLYVAEDEDDECDRTVFRCFTCPKYETCQKSRESFRKAATYSLIDEDTCREYVVRHLLGAGVHKDDGLTEEEATTLAENAEITVVIETFKDRQEYREQLRRHEEAL